MGEAVFSEDCRRQRSPGCASAQRALDEVHVFGWRWRAPYDRLVPERKRALALATKDFEAAVRERDALMSDAKASVGVWSAYGVEEVRGLFWDAYQSGKDFAKRMTWWDVLLGGVGRRDEELWATLLRWLGQVMMNFTIGLFSALVSFAFSLVSMLWAYKASYLSGLLFFAVAMSGATAMVGLFVGGMYATAVGGVYVPRRRAPATRASRAAAAAARATSATARASAATTGTRAEERRIEAGSLPSRVCRSFVRCADMRSRLHSAARVRNSARTARRRRATPPGRVGART